MKNQKDYIDEQLDSSTTNSIFTVNLYQMDMERVRYSLSRYLRTRILKIEDQLEAIISNLDLMDRLSFKGAPTLFRIVLKRLYNNNNTVFNMFCSAIMPYITSTL